MGPEESIRFFAATDVGRVRDHNEDNFLVDKKLCALRGRRRHGRPRRRRGRQRDRRPHHPRGGQERAAAHRRLRRGRDAARQGHRTATSSRCWSTRCSARARASTRRRRPTRRSAAWARRSRALLIVGTRGFIAHVGDSRIYLMRGGRVQQVTEDHTVFNELIKRGKLTREQIEKVAHKNAITRAVGVYERVEVDTLIIEVLPGDQFLLASDGLHGYIDTHRRARRRTSTKPTATRRSRQLVELANEAGGKDNITAVVVRLGEGDAKDNERAKQLALKREVLAQDAAVRAPLRARAAAGHAGGRGARLRRRARWSSARATAATSSSSCSRARSACRAATTVLTTFGSGEHFGEMALIRSVPRSATVHARRRPASSSPSAASDFFEILRKEHEIAVKLLWQFLGVLADRLDQTSSDLRVARAELTAEDITAEIFPVGMDEDEETTDPYGRGRRAGNDGPPRTAP